MSHTDEKSEQRTNMEQLKEGASSCGSGCSCNTGPSGRARWVVGAIVVVIAGVLVVRAVMKGDGGQSQGAGDNFALSQPSPAKEAATDSAAEAPEDKPQIPGIAAPPEAAADESEDMPQTPGIATPPEAAADKPEDKLVVCGKTIQSLGDLNREAVDNDGVLVFMAGPDPGRAREVLAIVERTAATIRGRGVNLGLFTLEKGSRQYAELAVQVPPPGVIAMVKGRGASAVSDDITESKLMQAFVAASSAGGCGPSGCGPSGCR